MKAWGIMGNTRIGRLRGLAYDFSVFLLISPLLALEIWLAFQGELALSIAVNILTTLVAVPIQIMFSIRRLHDIGASGYWSVIQVPMALLNFRGMIGLHPSGLVLVLVILMYLAIVAYALVLLFAPGDDGDNRFGPPPPPNSTWVIVGATAAIVIPAAAFVFAVLVAIARAAP